VNENLSCPVYATLLVCKLNLDLGLPLPQPPLIRPPKAIFATGLGAIPLGSSTAFLDLTGSFVILSTVSYAIPFACNLITRRKYMPPGPFWMGKAGFFVNAAAVLLITFFNIFYCFRKGLLLFPSLSFFFSRFTLELTLSDPKLTPCLRLPQP
jgi:choline transport protein